MTTPVPDLKVGDQILFDHFGGKDRRGAVVKITPSAVHVQWMAPSSGKVRVVKLSTKPRPAQRHEVLAPGIETYIEAEYKNIRIEIRPTGVWKNYTPEAKAYEIRTKPRLDFVNNRGE